MAGKKYLIFDIGASNGRAIISRFDGRKFEMEEIHRFANRPVYLRDTLYWDILRLFSEVKIGIHKAVNKHEKLSSMAIDTWGVDFGLMDKNGMLISNPIHYRDEKINLGKELLKIINEDELFSLTGGELSPIVTLFQIYSMKIQNSISLKNSKKVLLIPDLFRYFLTGIMNIEYTNATTTLMYNQSKKEWEEKILKKAGISMDLLPEIIEPGTIVSNISKEIKEELGIKNLKVIAPASHDIASASAGIPIINKNKNQAFIIIGTWAVVGLETKMLLINKEIQKSGFFNEGGVEGNNLFVKNMNGLWIIQQCREKWNKGRNLTWDNIVELSGLVETNMSFINIDDPIFSEPQSDMPKVISEYLIKTGQSIIDPDDIGKISRCVYESIALHLRYYLDVMIRITGKSIDLIHLSGGGAKDSLLCQFAASALERLVVIGPTETTSVGNLLMQLIAAGEISTLDQGRQLVIDSTDILYYEPKDEDIWKRAYEKYLRLIEIK